MKRIITPLLFLLLSLTLSAQWVQLNIPSVDYIALATGSNGAGGTNIFAATGGSGVRLSTDMGTTWTSVNGGDGVLNNTVINALSIVPKGSGKPTVLVGNGGLGVFRSTNNGTDWTSVGIGNHEVISFAVSPDGTQLFAGTRSDGIYHSTNDGVTWTKIGLSSKAVYAITVTSNGSGGINVFAGTWYTGLFLLTNSGGLWTETNLGFTDDFVYMLHNAPNGAGGSNIFLGTSGGPNLGLYVSANNGTNWTPVLTGINSGVNSLVVTALYYFAATSEGVFVSKNGGITWNPANEGLTNFNVSSLVIAGTDLFAATVGEVGPTSVWKRPLSELTSVRRVSAETPPAFNLHQNYPNPFNPTTQIVYELPAESWVRLELYDITGRKVSTLIDGHAASGSYAYMLDMQSINNGLPAGTYMYKLTILDISTNTASSFAKKMIFLK